MSNVKCQLSNVNAGFTLIELIVSVALLVLLAMGIGQIFPRAIAVNRVAEKTTRATYFAQAELETIIETEYVSIATGTIEPRHTVSPGYDRQTIVEYLNPTTLDVSISDQGLKRVTTTVFYQSVSGERTIILPVIVANH